MARSKAKTCQLMTWPSVVLLAVCGRVGPETCNRKALRRLSSMCLGMQGGNSGSAAEGLASPEQARAHRECPRMKGGLHWRSQPLCSCGQHLHAHAALRQRSAVTIRSQQQNMSFVIEQWQSPALCAASVCGFSALVKVIRFS